MPSRIRTRPPASSWTAGGQDENHQKRMMGEVAKLIDNADGKLIEAAYKRTADALLARRSSPRSRQAPARPTITDKAIK